MFLSNGYGIVFWMTASRLNRSIIKKYFFSGLLLLSLFFYSLVYCSKMCLAACVGLFLWQKGILFFNWVNENKDHNILSTVKLRHWGFDIDENKQKMTVAPGICFFFGTYINDVENGKVSAIWVLVKNVLISEVLVVKFWITFAIISH